MNRVQFAEHFEQDRMTAFVVGCDIFFFFRDDSGFLFRTNTDLDQSLLNFFHIDLLFAVSCCQQGCFVQQVCQVCACEACSCLGNDLQIHFGSHGFAFGMYAQDGFSAFYVRSANINLSVETTGSQQGRVQNIRTVCCCNDDHAFVDAETVHFNQQLVQCLLSFIVTAAKTCASATTNGVDFIDEYDTGRVLLRLFKQVTDTGCTDTDEHFYEVRTRDAEERHTRLTSNCLCQQCFTCTGRAHQQYPFGDACAQICEFLRGFQEVYQFFQFGFFLITASYVIECYFIFPFYAHFGFAFAKVRHFASAAVHLVEQEGEDDDHDDHHKDRGQDGRQETFSLQFPYFHTEAVFCRFFIQFCLQCRHTGGFYCDDAAILQGCHNSTIVADLSASGNLNGCYIIGIQFLQQVTVDTGFCGCCLCILIHQTRACIRYCRQNDDEHDRIKTE